MWGSWWYEMKRPRDGDASCTCMHSDVLDNVMIICLIQLSTEKIWAWRWRNKLTGNWKPFGVKKFRDLLPLLVSYPNVLNINALALCRTRLLLYPVGSLRLFGRLCYLFLSYRTSVAVHDDVIWESVGGSDPKVIPSVHQTILHVSLRYQWLTFSFSPRAQLQACVVGQLHWVRFGDWGGTEYRIIFLASTQSPIAYREFLAYFHIFSGSNFERLSRLMPILIESFLTKPGCVVKVSLDDQTE